MIMSKCLALLYCIFDHNVFVSLFLHARKRSSFTENNNASIPVMGTLCIVLHQMTFYTKQTCYYKTCDNYECHIITRHVIHYECHIIQLC